MKHAVLSLLLVAAAILPAAWGAQGRTQKPRKLYNCQEQIRKAIAKYEKKRYGDVKILLDEIKLQCAGSSVIDTVHYYLGMAQIAGKLPADARIEFEALIRNFPNSFYSEEAHFRLGQCSMLESNAFDRDQAKTREAIREMEDFVSQYPQSRFADSARAFAGQCFEKLAKKEFSIARFYDNLGEPDAAVIYYRAVIADFPQTWFALESKLLMAAALIRTNRFAEAQLVVDDVLAGSYGPEVARRARELQEKIKTGK